MADKTELTLEQRQREGEVRRFLTKRSLVSAALGVAQASYADEQDMHFDAQAELADDILKSAVGEYMRARPLFVVRHSNYEPMEVESIWYNEDDAVKRAKEKGDMWTVDTLEVD
jgi:hypothetical protein